jgi:hypothetical protein
LILYEVIVSGIVVKSFEEAGAAAWTARYSGRCRVLLTTG